MNPADRPRPTAVGENTKTTSVTVQQKREMFILNSLILPEHGVNDVAHEDPVYMLCNYSM